MASSLWVAGFPHYQHPVADVSQLEFPLLMLGSGVQVFIGFFEILLC